MGMVRKFEKVKESALWRVARVPPAETRGRERERGIYEENETTRGFLFLILLSSQ
jgi:hypothetical protein